MAKKSVDNGKLKWSGPCTIEQAKTIQEQTIKALTKASDKLTLDLSEVTDIDVSCMQIILAASKEAASLNKEFKILDSIPGFIKTFADTYSISIESMLIPAKETDSKKEAENA
ncbi:MAG: STAS domain-containing protein [Treponema sp.]|nr:STAS domain-containing protein [Treponema sp.]